MTENIPVQRAIYNKDRFPKVIDTQFKEFAILTPVAPELTIDEFFTLYEELFSSIPKEGDINSQRYILNKTAEYLGVRLADDTNIDVLLQEITTLRQQLLTIEAENIKLLQQSLNG